MQAAFGYSQPFVVQTSLDVQEPEEQIRDVEDDLSTQGSGQVHCSRQERVRIGLG